MPAKITFIGAGSVVFTRNLCSDILLTPALQDATITLMDIDATRLAQARDLVQTLIDKRGLKASVEATTDQRDETSAQQYADYLQRPFCPAIHSRDRHEIDRRITVDDLHRIASIHTEQ